MSKVTPDIESLADYVAAHPIEYSTRWRLAKKLYMAWEYAEALKHLLILKKNWTKKLHVLRYLAATFYRLGRYDESITELKEMLQQWPNEVSVWEQLARVYEVAGNPDKAAETWEHVLAITKNHPLAVRTIHRLRGAPRSTSRDDLRLGDSDSGIDMGPALVCKACGAQNGAEFDRCWQCHAPLHRQRPSVTPEPIALAVQAASPRSWQRTLIGGLATVAALSASLHLALAHWSETIPNAANPVPFAVYDALVRIHFVTRIVIALALVVIWPVSLWLAMRVRKLPIPPWPSFCGAGLLLASITYLTCWIPAQLLSFAPMIPLLASLIVVILLAPLHFGDVLRVWVVQSAITAAAGVAVLAANGTLAPLSQLSAIARYARAQDNSPEPGKYTLETTSVPGTSYISWDPSGSHWLDTHASEVSLTFYPQPETNPFAVQITQQGHPIAYADEPPHQVTCSVTPGVQYEITFTGTTNTKVTTTAFGILRPHIEH